MKILIDECLPRRLKSLLKPLECYTVQDMGWAGKVNGNLMRLAIEAGFEVFLTVDKNLRFQNPLKVYDISLIVLDIVRNTYDLIEPLGSEIIKAVQQSGEKRLQIIGQ